MELTTHQISMLLELRDSPGITQIALSEEIDESYSCVRFHVSYLVSIGYITKGDNGKRSKRLHLTELGYDYINKILEHNPSVRDERVWVLNHFNPRVNELNRELFYYDDKLDEFVQSS